MSYIILTNKEAYQTNLHSEGIELVESYDYVFFDKIKASYSIVKVVDPACKIIITEDGEKKYVNHVPVKFFETFDDLEGAREELWELVGANVANQKLVKKVS